MKCYFRSSEAKLNNFMRLEPTFRLLEIPFNINMVRIEQLIVMQNVKICCYHSFVCLLCVGSGCYDRETRSGH